MIVAIAAVWQFAMFGIWKTDDWFNITMKLVFLALGLALTFVSLKEFGYIVSI